MSMSFDSRRLMSRWAVLLAIAAVSVVAACSSDSEAEPTNTRAAATQPAATETPVPTQQPEATATATTAPTAMTPDESGVSVEMMSVSAHGNILVDGNGLTLYIFDNDTEGVSNCSGGCLSAWPPLIADSAPEVGSGVTATIGMIDRGDGQMQVTVNGFPAYYWQGDSAPGDTNGNAVGNNWWVFNADGTPQRPAKVSVMEDDEYGSILTDGAGLTLYIFDNDTEGVSNCSGGCLNAWPPLLADYGTVSLDGVEATIGAIDRGDGTMQATVNGFPAYYWQGDSAPGDTLGNAVGNNWWVFNADGTPQRPAKVSVLEDDEHGSILTDRNGFTLYIFDNDTEGVSNCSGNCLANWPPLLAEYGVVAANGVDATVGMIDRGDGTMQVTVNGFPAYYWQGDAAVGDTLGNARGNNWWVFNPDGSPQRPAKLAVLDQSTYENILVGPNGLSLYIFDNDTVGVSNCTGGCLTAWPPLLSEYGAVGLEGVDAELGTITRDDETVQVTVNGLPVYYWQGDSQPDDADGHGRNQLWWLVRPDGTPLRAP